jgi:hypothetical protein
MSDQFGSYRINPAFDRHREEAAIIGRILASFGEIEFSVCRNAGHATNMPEQVPKALYRLRMTSARLELADALMKSAFVSANLGEEYAETQVMVSRCLQIRNQYAHCNWADHAPNPEAGLFFADLQKAADSDAVVHESLAYRHVDVPLLEAQMEYFCLTMEWLSYLDAELGFLAGRLGHHAWPKPPRPALPPLHNPPEKHVPPFLSVGLQALHLARAHAALGGHPTPTPAQQALEAARVAKKAGKQADRDRSTAQRSGTAKPEPDG